MAQCSLPHPRTAHKWANLQLGTVHRFRWKRLQRTLPWALYTQLDGQSSDLGLLPRPLPCLPPLPFALGFLGSLGGVKGVVRVRLGGGGVGVLGRSRPL